jgi:hypothetical protein
MSIQEAILKMHLTPMGCVLQDKWITHLFYENYGVRQTDSKCSNIAARCRSHKGFGSGYIKLNMMNQQGGSGF